MGLTRARLPWLLLALAGVAIALRLGWWQWDRAAQKQALQAALDARAALPPLDAGELVARAATTDAAELRYRRVHLRGRWLAEHAVYLDNRSLDGRPGFIVVMPLAWTGGAVLVQRGWVARDGGQRARLPPLATPAGEVEVAGLVAPWPTHYFEFVDAAAAASGPIRQNLDLAAYRREIGVAVLPLSVQQVGAAGDDGLVRRWPAPSLDHHKNLGYAFQWWALAVLIIALYVWTQFLRNRRRGAR